MNPSHVQTSPDPAAAPILERALAGGRLSDENALLLFESHDLLALGQTAHAARLKLHPDPVVTFIIDRNINYTNVCVSGCKPCAFHRAPGDPAGYVLSREDLRRKIIETYEAGGRQILLQGGLNPELTLEYFEDLLRWLKAEFPTLHVHGFSPPEVSFLADRADLPLEAALERLIAAGLGSIPGGGAEILSDEVRRIVSPRKITSDGWISVMRTAHRLGLRTTATMMFGLVETPAQRVEHLRRVRELQDETGGFTAFIAWPFQPGNTGYPDRRAGAFDYLKTVAIARLYLDNIANIQASWVTQGGPIAQIALLMGANDLGSLMLEENVVAAAGTHFEYTREELKRWAGELGFELRQRDCFYRPFTPEP